jgi:D-alanyl-D-alanine carboxypeptidase
MEAKSPDSKLEDFRYDAKLFKQAYSAGLKLKEIEKKQKQKRTLYIVGGFFLTILLFLSILFIIRSPLFKSKSYIEAKFVETPFESVRNDIPASPVSEFDSFDQTFLEANVALYADLNTGHIYYAKNIDEQVYIASITKLMSALVALQRFELSESVEVKQDWFAQENMSWSIEMDKGDITTVETLLNAMLISSYNDAAFALADHMEGGWEAFVEEMNLHAKTLGLENTEFFNPSGLDDYGANVSTARDLYKLSTIVYRNNFIMNTISKGYIKLEWDIGEEDVYSTNVLLNQYGIIGGKTGQTEKAGGCFLSITKDGRMTLVLGSENRFDETVKLLTEL